MLRKWNALLNQCLDLNFGATIQRNKKKLNMKQSDAILFASVIVLVVVILALNLLGQEILPETM